jgi:hypothetical protein
MTEWRVVLFCKREYAPWLPVWLDGCCRRRDGRRHQSDWIRCSGCCGWLGGFRERLGYIWKDYICRWGLRKRLGKGIDYCMWLLLFLMMAAAASVATGRHDCF